MGENWDYQLLSRERQILLKNCRKFEELASEIGAHGTVVSSKVEPCCDRAIQEPFARAVTRIAIPDDLFDQFYNGSDGLRARYWANPEVGDAATRLLLDQLMRKLCDAFTIAVPLTDAWQMTAADWRVSLSRSSAKVWVAEWDRDCQLLSRDVSEYPLVERWLTNERLLESKGPQWRWAPHTGDVEVKGAFVSVGHREHVPEGKRDRGNQIWRYGFP